MQLINSTILCAVDDVPFVAIIEVDKQHRMQTIVVQCLYCQANRTMLVDQAQLLYMRDADDFVRYQVDKTAYTINATRDPAKVQHERIERYIRQIEVIRDHVEHILLRRLDDEQMHYYPPETVFCGACGGYGLFATRHEMPHTSECLLFWMNRLISRIRRFGPENPWSEWYQLPIAFSLKTLIDSWREDLNGMSPPNPIRIKDADEQHD